MPPHRPRPRPAFAFRRYSSARSERFSQDSDREPFSPRRETAGRDQRPTSRRLPMRSTRTLFSPVPAHGVVLSFILISLATPCWATTRYVSKSGTDAGDCTAEPGCLTINYGLSQTTGGDTLVIHGGTYN